MRRSRLVPVLGCAALVLSAAACSAPTTAKPTVGTLPLNLIVPDPGNFTSGLPVYVALAQGFFKREHLSVTVVDTTGGATNVAAVLAGKGAIGVDTGPVSVLAANLHGADLKILGADTTGMDILFFAKSGGPIKSIYDLAGQKVGFSSPGSSSNVALNVINADLKARGLKPAVGEVIGGPPMELTAVQTNQIAAGFTAAPNLFSQVQSGSIRLLTSLSSYPAYTDVAVRVIFGAGSYIKSHPTQVREFLTAWHEAWAYAFAHHTQALTDWRNGAKLTEPVPVLATGFRYYTPSTQRLLPLDGLQRDISDAVSLGVLKAPLTSGQLAADLETSYAASATSAGSSSG
jgi:NitT/TauT family transport system substrate-binding protein